MISLKALRDAVDDGVKWAGRQKDAIGVEVFASSNVLTTMRLGLANNIPSNALEEFKSLEDFGIGVRVHFNTGRIGFGKESSDLSLNAVKSALEKARKSCIKDPFFVSLPQPAKEKQAIKNYHDPAVLKFNDVQGVKRAYLVLDGALSAVEKRSSPGGLNMTGELDFLGEQMAIASTTGISAVDQSSIVWGHLTATLEGEKDVAGMHFDSNTHIKNFNTGIGREAVERAFASVDARPVETGTYHLALGHQVICDIFSNVFDASLQSVDFNASFLQGKKGQKVFDEAITMYDDPHLPYTIGSKAFNDEGQPTVSTPLVEKGKLVNFLSNDYYAKKFAREKGETYLGRNGFRFGGGGGRNYSSEPGIHSTNLVIQKGSLSQKELFESVDHGLYIDRIWYTYPVNGSKVSDFTCTVRGNSYVIRNGERAEPLLPNSVRINANLERMLSTVMGIGKVQQPIIVWGSEGVVVTPEIAVRDVHVERIARFLM
ncbi:MAG: TldD/PmbA family protein [Candidatus Diapherotrites archaeon]|nr:TldD/PmbA family protein [Candidatus Diapherotrites archaeon]